MILLEVTLPVVKEIMKQNLEILKALRKVDPWYKDLLPAFYASVGALVAILGQWQIFKLTKRKEIKLRVAELYGKVRSKSINYRMTLEEMNKKYFLHIANKALRQHYSEIINADDYDPSEYDPNDEDAVDFGHLQTYHQNLSNTYATEYNSLFEQHKNEKLILVDMLYQIHFYYNDETIDKYIDTFRAVTLLPTPLIPNVIVEYKKQDFYNTLFHPLVKTQREEVKQLFENISKKMLKF